MHAATGAATCTRTKFLQEGFELRGVALGEFAVDGNDAPKRLARKLEAQAPAQFARWAREVWGVDAKGKDDLMVALEGIDRLQTFIGEMGLPTSFAEMDSDASDETLHKVAGTCVLTGGCAEKLVRSEVIQILTECL